MPSQEIEYTAYPRIPLEAVRLLWIVDYNDLTLSGMLVYQGKLRWYQICDYVREMDTHRYLVRELTDDEAADEEKWQPLFLEHVGDHFAASGARHEAKPPSEAAKFYGPYGQRARSDYSTRPIIGWFEM